MFLLEEAPKPASSFTFWRCGEENDICFLKEKKLIRKKGFLFFCSVVEYKGTRNVRAGPQVSVLALRVSPVVA